MSNALAIDVVIFGGGVAGLWLLDELTRSNYNALLIEPHALGHGQTICAQGIIHGGIKYTLDGLITPSASAISEMPTYWNDRLLGKAMPDLSGVTRLSDACYMWRTDSWTSRLGLLGAQIALRTRPDAVPANERPAPLRKVPGDVYRVAEPVIDTSSLLSSLAAPYINRILASDPDSEPLFEREGDRVVRVTLKIGSHEVKLMSRFVVLTAGAGNENLRARLGLAPGATQRRPLHMVMLRGASLPLLWGHCVDGKATRVTITSNHDTAGRVVWQLGGQIAEDGVGKEADVLLTHAARELRAVLPGLDLNGIEAATYRIDRAEAATPGGRRPENIRHMLEGNVITAWPTKLALAPILAAEVRALLPLPQANLRGAETILAALPHPPVASPPWERPATWTSVC